MAGGGKTQSTAPTRYNGIQVQSAVAGDAITQGWGTFRAPANLLWYGAFKSVAQTQQGGGKGGGGSTISSYTYSAAIVLGICAGPISIIRTVYKDQTALTDGAQTALQQAGLSVANGDFGQAAWGFLTANFPDQAIGYSGIAYAYANDYALSASATLQNHSFEIVTLTRVAGFDDANPKDVVPAFLALVPYWQSGFNANLTDYGHYCLAAGLLLSPVLESQRQGSDFLSEVLQASNSDCVFSDGVLKIAPYGDTEITGNGVTWTPDLTPVYDLDETHFIPASPGSDPVEVDINRAADAYNYVQVEFLDRSNQYNTQVAVALDQAAIDQNGRRPAASPYSLHSICVSSTASNVAQLIVQRTANVRRTFKFTLSAAFCLLEPHIDKVTLTSGDLNRVLVRITQTRERVDGQFADVIDFTAEEMLVGTAHAAEYDRQSSDGFKPDFNIDPGNVADFALLCPPRTLTNGDYEVWIGAAGGSANWGGAQVWASLDGTNYQMVGEITNAARLGTTGALALAADPDTSHTLAVDLTATQGTLLDATQADVDSATTLFMLDTELMAYRDSTLTGAYVYDLAYLRRGLYGTAPAAHTSGAPFIRLDEAIVHIPYDAAQVGSTFHVKLLSFNVFGRAVQSLADVTAHTITLDPGAAPVVDIVSTDTTHVSGRPSSTVISQIDAALTLIASALAEIDAANATIASVNANLLGITDLSGIELVRQSLAHLDLRDLANTWTALDGERITVPVAYGKQVFSLLGTISGDGSAFVFNGATVWVSPTQSFASYQTQVQANYASNLALISSESATRASADGAMAANITSVSAVANGAAATSTINQTAIANLNGQLFGSITLITNANGAVASMQLLSVSGAVNLGAVIFDVNQFLVKDSSHPNVSPFFYDATSGTLFSNTITVRTANIANAAIQHAQIDVLSVGTINIQGGAVDTSELANNAVSGIAQTQVATGQTLTTSTEITDLTTSVTTHGGQVLVDVYGGLGTTSASAAGAVVRAYCDGVLVGQQGSVFNPGSFGEVGVSLPLEHQPSAGTHTYSVTYEKTAGSGSCIAVRTSLRTTELKK